MKLERQEGEESESVWVKITEAGQKDFTVVGVCNRSQTGTEKEIYDMFRAISIASKYQALIMGDFNYQGINWETLEADSMSQGFFDLTQDCFLMQHVLVPTRYNNILDLVITTKANVVENTQVMEHFCNCGHNILEWDLVLTTHITDKMHKNTCFYKACWDERLLK